MGGSKKDQTRLRLIGEIEALTNDVPPDFYNISIKDLRDVLAKAKKENKKKNK